MITVDFSGVRAHLEGGEWGADNEVVVEALEGLIEGLQIPGSHPYPDMYLVEKTIEYIGYGRITSADPPPLSVRDRVY